jgi:hypothetical protein
MSCKAVALYRLAGVTNDRDLRFGVPAAIRVISVWLDALQRGHHHSGGIRFAHPSPSTSIESNNRQSKKSPIE